MVANTTSSVTSVKQSTKKTSENITPAEAAQILQSAIAYLNLSGLQVSGYNEGNTLILQIDGVNYEDDSIILAGI